MAFWIPLAIAAASYLGSNYLNSAAAEDVGKAQLKAQLAENTRQDDLRSRAQMSFKDLLAKNEVSAQLADEDAEAAKLQAAYTNMVDQTPDNLLPGQGDASATVQTDVVNEGNKSVGKALKAALARGRLESFGRVGLNNDIAFDNANRNLNDIASQSRGSANILPLEMKAAESKGAGKRNFANLLNLVGSTAGSVAAGGLFDLAMAPGAFGGEQALATIGDKVITPSLGVYSVGPAPGIYGPAIQKSGWGALAKGLV